MLVLFYYLVFIELFVGFEVVVDDDGVGVVEGCFEGGGSADDGGVLVWGVVGFGEGFE